MEEKPQLKTTVAGEREEVATLRNRENAEFIVYRSTSEPQDYLRICSRSGGADRDR